MVQHLSRTIFIPIPKWHLATVRSLSCMTYMPSIFLVSHLCSLLTQTCRNFVSSGSQRVNIVNVACRSHSSLSFSVPDPFWSVQYRLVIPYCQRICFGHQLSVNSLYLSCDCHFRMRHTGTLRIWTLVNRALPPLSWNVKGLSSLIGISRLYC